MKAIFPDAKSLQPMPNISSVHPNISGNINSTTNVMSNNASTQNISNTQNNIPTTTQINNQKGNFFIFYFIGLIIIIGIIIFYRKLRQK